MNYKICLVTMAFGEPQEEILDLTIDNMKMYCHRFGFDFYRIQERKYLKDNNNNILCPYMEKFQIKNILEQYDYVLWVDSDVLIKKHCQNIFDNVNNKKGVFAVYDNRDNKCIYNKEIDIIQECLGYVGWESGYFNNGVFIVSKEYKNIFNNPEKRNESKHISHDQTLMNYNVIKNKVPFYLLNSKWNKIGSNCGIQECCFFHAAGPSKMTKFNMICNGGDYNERSWGDKYKNFDMKTLKEKIKHF